MCEAIPGLELDAAAHAREHAIEVELPLLHRLAPQSKVVGIVLGEADWPQCQKFARGLAEVIGKLPQPPLLLISSDMHHFASDAENRRLDEAALTALETLNPRHLLEVVQEQEISMCGVIPAVIVLETLRQLGTLHKAGRTSRPPAEEERATKLAWWAMRECCCISLVGQAAKIVAYFSLSPRALLSTRSISSPISTVGISSGISASSASFFAFAIKSRSS